MANWNFPTEVKFMGYNRYEYPGAFPENVDKVIKGLVKAPCIHLFSGVSNIGSTRVDLERKEATHNVDVFDFIKTEDARKSWEFCVLDPPYNIHNAEKDLNGYGDFASVSCSVPKRNALSDFFRMHCKNVLWFDFCAPIPKGFMRKKVWFFFPGGYRTIRILSWLQRDGRRLDEFK